MEIDHIEGYPFISIVIPAKNEENNIGHCLSGIQKSEYPKSKYEIVLVDNGSTDKTIVIAEKMGAQTYIVPNVTIAALRNYGVNKSRGDIIFFIDSDCIPEKQWLIKAVDTMLSEKGIVAVGGILNIKNEKSKYWIEEYWLKYLNSKYQHDIQYVNTLSSFCFAVQRATIEDVGGFNENLVTCEDSDLGYRISKSGGKIVVNRNIKVNHLRNAKNSWEFFKRQLWQGRSNIMSFFFHGFILKELPSVMVPLLFLIAIICTPLTFFLEILSPLKWLLILLLIALPATITLKTQVGREKKKFWGYLYIWFLYLSARGLGMFVKIAQWKR